MKVYADSNVFITALVSEATPKSTASMRVLAEVESGSATAFTSVLTWDEVVWVVRKLMGRGDSVSAGEKLSGFPNLRFVSASEEIMRLAQKLVGSHDILPRDAIHAATAISKEVDVFISDDSDFDKLGQLKRMSPESFASRKR